MIRAVAFGAADWCDELNEINSSIEIAYRPVINEFRGYRNVEIHLVDWRRPSGSLSEELSVNQKNGG